MYSLATSNQSVRCVDVYREIMVPAPDHRVRRRRLPCSTAGDLPDTYDASTRRRRPGTPAGATRAGTATSANRCRTRRETLDRGGAVPAQITR